MTIREALKSAEAALAAAGVPDAQTDARLLLSHVTGMESMQMRLSPSLALTGEQEGRLRALLRLRAGRRPLQYLLGTQCFYGFDLRVDERALIPRQETETLCEIGMEFLRELHAKGMAQPKALDLCTGSGALAVALKQLCPWACVAATDMSADALALARENAALVEADVALRMGDLFAPVKGERFDLILSNPPYVPTAECAALQAEVRFEPVMALDGGEDGLAFYRRIAWDAPEFMLPGGLLAVEVGDGQAAAVAALLEQVGFTAVAVRNDLYGKARVVSARAAFT